MNRWNRNHGTIPLHFHPYHIIPNHWAGLLPGGPDPDTHHYSFPNKKAAIPLRKYQHNFLPALWAGTFHPKDILKDPKELNRFKKAQQEVRDIPKPKFDEILYRGTSEVTPTDYGIFGKGTYFTPSIRHAEGYAQRGIPGEGKLIKQRVILKNPLEITAEELHNIRDKLKYGEEQELWKKDALPPVVQLYS